MTESECIVRRATGRALNWMERAKAWANAVFTDRADYSRTQERIFLRQGEDVASGLLVAINAVPAGEESTRARAVKSQVIEMINGWLKPQKSIAPGPRLGWMMKPTPETEAALAALPPLDPIEIAKSIIRRIPSESDRAAVLSGFGEFCRLCGCPTPGETICRCDQSYGRAK